MNRMLTLLGVPVIAAGLAIGGCGGATETRAQKKEAQWLGVAAKASVLQVAQEYARSAQRGRAAVYGVYCAWQHNDSYSCRARISFTKGVLVDIYDQPFDVVADGHSATVVRESGSSAVRSYLKLIPHLTGR
jgi:hypothetical protein